jgi:hypothetical protein
MYVTDQSEAPNQPKKRAIGSHYTRGGTGHTAGLGVFGEQEISWELGSLKKYTIRGLQIYSHVQQCS